MLLDPRNSRSYFLVARLDINRALIVDGTSRRVYLRATGIFRLYFLENYLPVAFDEFTFREKNRSANNVRFN